MSPPKSCMVCGDKALGYNFSAVTCESCKAFFRRNALAKKQFTCPFNQNCEITVVTRRFCQKCRLKKCLDIGMKSENIMSEEDKLIKRRKIETNRAKRKINEPNGNSNKSKDAREKQAAADSSGIAANEVYGYDSQSCGSFDSANGPASNEGCSASTSSSTTPALAEVSSESMSGAEIVDFIVCDPDRATQAINKLMRNPSEAMATLEKVINSQSDALRLISHLIAYPGDALKIISKVMNSPLNALTVFTKFMSSPTDALEIISKIVSSPQDVLHFIKQLMDAPEDALNLMNKFLNTPAEALRIINKMVNGSNTIRDEEISNLGQQQTLQDSGFSVPTPLLTNNNNNTSQQLNNVKGENVLIHSMLNSSPGSANEFLIASSPSPPSSVPTLLQTPVEQLAVSPNDMQYDSTESIHDELHSTSASILPSTPQPIDDVADFSTENFDIKSFIQTSFPDNLTSSSTFDSINSLESVLTEVIRIEYEAFNSMPQEPRVKREQHNTHHSAQQQFLNTGHQLQQPICSPSSVSVGRDLNEAELMKLRELKIASEALYYPVDEDLNELVVDEVRIKPEDTHQDPKLLQVINLTAVAIKRLIKMAKKITAFRDMCQEDQVALLKGGCTEMMIMRSVMTYDDNRNTWKIPHTKEDMSNIRAEVLKLAKGNVYEEHLRFIRTFDEKWRMDENIILIMCAIVLFTPSRSRIIHSDVIKLEQNSYYYLLRRYLESVYPGCEAKSAFIKLIQKISDVERLNQFIIGVYLNVNPSQVEPLLREIFDLKNH